MISSAHMLFRRVRPGLLFTANTGENYHSKPAGPCFRTFSTNTYHVARVTLENQSRDAGNKMLSPSIWMVLIGCVSPQPHMPQAVCLAAFSTAPARRSLKQYNQYWAQRQLMRGNLEVSRLIEIFPVATSFTVHNYQPTSRHDPPSMDPLAALGVASNVLAVVDFAWTILTEARTIHRSSSGLGNEAEFVDTIANNINLLDQRLLLSSNNATRELQILINESQKIVSELQHGLLSLKTRKKGSKLQSCIAALKETWGRDKVSGLTTRFRTLQTRIMMHIQVTMQYDTLLR